MTPHAESIKACYDPQSPASAECTAAAPPVKQAYSVLVFQEQQQQQLGQAAGTQVSSEAADDDAERCSEQLVRSICGLRGDCISVDVWVSEPQEQQAEAAHPAIPEPQLLARFKVNHSDTLAVFRAVSPEDFADVAGLLPPNTALPAQDKMTYLLARLEVGPDAQQQLPE